MRRVVKVARPVEVKLPPLAVVKKRLVEDAVVEKKLVVVAEVPVALVKVKFWRVVELVRRRVAGLREPERYRSVPVADVKVKLVNEPVGPETVAPVRVELVKMP